MGSVTNFNLLNKKKGGSELGAGIRMAILFMGAMLTIVVLGFVIVVVVGNLETSGNNALPTLNSGEIANETLTTVTEAGEFLSPAASLYDLACSIVVITNATGDGSDTVPTSNYTLTTTDRCQLSYVITNGAAEPFNNSDWNVTYTYTYKNAGIRDTTQNVSEGTMEFFSNATTWFSLLSIVIIIAVVIVVVLVVRKARGGSGVSRVASKEPGL